MTSPPSPSTPPSVVKQSAFEGLFVHVLKVPPDGPFADALRRVGYDLRRQEGEYPSRVWTEAVAVACREVHPGQPLAEAQRALGARFIEGFLQTLAGRALAVVLPLTGPEGALRRLPRFLAMGAPALRGQVHEDAPRSWRIEVHAAWANAHFDAGFIETGVQRTGAPIRVEVLESAQDRYLLQVRW